MDVINAKSNTYLFVEVVIYSEILRTNCRMNQSSSHLAIHMELVVMATERSRGKQVSGWGFGPALIG